jgi:hypothetical protein
VELIIQNDYKQAEGNRDDNAARSGTEPPDTKAFRDFRKLSYEMLDEEYAQVLYAIYKQMWWAEFE